MRSDSTPSLVYGSRCADKPGRSCDYSEYGGVTPLLMSSAVGPGALSLISVLVYPAVGCAGNNIGIMLLNEVVLGKEHHITRDDSTITTPPTGYDSVVAKGRTEPG